jgi:hypothetical protein
MLTATSRRGFDERIKPLKDEPHERHPSENGGTAGRGKTPL